MMNFLKTIGVTVVMFSLICCGGESGPGKDGTKDDPKDSAKDSETAGVKLVPQSIIPDEARLRKALRDDVDAEIVKALIEHNAKMAAGAPPASDSASTLKVQNDPENLKAFMAGLATVFAKPGQTEIQVHGATTEQIVKYAEGTVPYAEFPGGARRVAEKLLRPGMTFYEVEYLEPGKTSGMKYHLFYWDGGQWSMFGPAWRVLPSP